MAEEHGNLAMGLLYSLTAFVTFWLVDVRGQRTYLVVMRTVEKKVANATNRPGMDQIIRF